MKPETFEFPFGSFYAYERYIVGEPAHGVDIGKPEARMVLDQIAVRYSKPWGYVGNRIHGNSVDPFVYLFAKKESPLFHSMAIVAHSMSMVKIASFEESFVRSAKLEFGVFFDVDIATQWIEASLDQAEGAPMASG